MAVSSGTGGSSSELSAAGAQEVEAGDEVIMPELRLSAPAWLRDATGRGTGHAASTLT